MLRPKSPKTVADKSSVVGPSKPRLWQVLGPGLITGAADDDPSGIATYSQAGAQFGFGLGWTLLFTYPLMVVIQAISARIGRTTGRGIGGNLKVHSASSVLNGTVGLLCLANVCDVGADLGAMAESARLLAPAVFYPDATAPLVENLEAANERLVFIHLAGNEQQGGYWQGSCRRLHAVMVKCFLGGAMWPNVP